MINTRAALKELTKQRYSSSIIKIVTNEYIELLHSLLTCYIVYIYASIIIVGQYLILLYLRAVIKWRTCYTEWYPTSTLCRPECAPLVFHQTQRRSKRDCNPSTSIIFIQNDFKVCISVLPPQKKRLEFTNILIDEL